MIKKKLTKGSPSLDLGWFPYSICEGQAVPFDSEELGKGNGSEEALGVRMKAECLLAVFRKVCHSWQLCWAVEL